MGGMIGGTGLLAVAGLGFVCDWWQGGVEIGKGLLASAGVLGSVGNVWLQGRAGKRQGKSPWNSRREGRLWGWVVGLGV